jgi:UrcA family protein
LSQRFALCAAPALPANFVRRRIACANVESTRLRDEAKERCARVTFKSWCPLQPSSLRRYHKSCSQVPFAVHAPRRIVMLMHQSRLTPVRVVGAVIAITAATLIADIAAAKERGAVTTVVGYSDLDLTQSADTARLYERLKYASQRVCNSYDGRELRMQLLHEACYDTALNDAVAKVNDAKLSSLHAAEPRVKLARGS